MSRVREASTCASSTCKLHGDDELQHDLATVSRHRQEALEQAQRALEERDRMKAELEQVRQRNIDIEERSGRERETGAWWQFRRRAPRNIGKARSR